MDVKDGMTAKEFQNWARRELYRRKVEEGICANEKCWGAADGGILCPFHAKKNRDSRNDHYRRKVGRPVRPRRCSRCDDVGHDIRTCEKPPDPAE